MSTDFLKPIISDNYAALLPALQTTLTDIARGYDPATTGTKTNTPVDCLQWNSVNSRWEKFNGTSWNALSSLYAINISGNAATASSAATATSGYFLSSAVDPKIELLKPGVVAAMWHIGASNLLGLLGTNGVGVANGGDIFTVHPSSGNTAISGTLTAGGSVTAPNFIGNASSATNSTNATYVSASLQVNSIIGKPAPLVMAAVAGTGSFECRSAGTGDSNLAGITLHNAGFYALHIALRADGYLGIGGYSRAAWSWYSAPNGDMTAAGNVIAYSDPRLKENIRPIKNALDKLKKLNGVHFKWRSDIAHVKCKAGMPDIGILANEVEAVFPEIVAESIDIEGAKYKMVAYDKLIPVLIEAIKEQQQQIKHLQKLAGI